MIKVLNRQCTACLHTSSTRRQNQTAPKKLKVESFSLRSTIEVNFVAFACRKKLKVNIPLHPMVTSPKLGEDFKGHYYFA